MRTKINVVITTRTVGDHFATIGVIENARTGRVLARCQVDRPYGFVQCAMADARDLARRRDYVIVEQVHGE